MATSTTTPASTEQAYRTPTDTLTRRLCVSVLYGVAGRPSRPSPPKCLHLAAHTVQQQIIVSACQKLNSSILEQKEYLIKIICTIKKKILIYIKDGDVIGRGRGQKWRIGESRGDQLGGSFIGDVIRQRPQDAHN